MSLPMDLSVRAARTLQGRCLVSSEPHGSLVASCQSRIEGAHVSLGLTPAAAISTRTWPCDGGGSSLSRNCMTYECRVEAVSESTSKEAERAMKGQCLRTTKVFANNRSKRRHRTEACTKACWSSPEAAHYANGLLLSNLFNSYVVEV